jgi:glycosyltransferase involved in cell wall biosynthesis
MSTRSNGPSLSVVIPTRNRLALLRECLQAIAAQTLRPSEVVVVVDGGEDVSRAGDGVDLPLVMLRNEVSQGQPAALNRGIRASTAECVAFCDDDDLFEPDHLETLARALAASATGLAYTDAHAFDADPARPVGILDRDFDRALLRVTNYIAPSTVAFRRAHYDRLQGLDESLPYYWDWDFFLRVSEVAKVTRAPGGRTSYRIHAGSSQTVAPVQERTAQLQRLCDKHGLGTLPVKHLFDLFRRP